MSDDICTVDFDNFGEGQTKGMKNFNQEITIRFNQNVELIEKELLQLKALLFLIEVH